MKRSVLRKSRMPRLRPFGADFFENGLGENPEFMEDDLTPIKNEGLEAVLEVKNDLLGGNSRSVVR